MINLERIISNYESDILSVILLEDALHGELLAAALIDSNIQQQLSYKELISGNNENSKINIFANEILYFQFEEVQSLFPLTSNEIVILNYSSNSHL